MTILSNSLTSNKTKKLANFQFCFSDVSKLFPESFQPFEILIIKDAFCGSILHIFLQCNMSQKLVLVLKICTD